MLKEQNDKQCANRTKNLLCVDVLSVLVRNFPPLHSICRDRLLKHIKMDWRTRFLRLLFQFVYNIAENARYYIYANIIQSAQSAGIVPKN